MQTFTAEVSPFVQSPCVIYVEAPSRQGHHKRDVPLCYLDAHWPWVQRVRIRDCGPINRDPAWAQWWGGGCLALSPSISVFLYQGCSYVMFFWLLPWCGPVSGRRGQLLGSLSRVRLIIGPEPSRGAPCLLSPSSRLSFTWPYPMVKGETLPHSGEILILQWTDGEAFLAFSFLLVKEVLRVLSLCCCTDGHLLLPS